MKANQIMKNFASLTDEKEVEIKDANGKIQTFKVRRFASLGEMESEITAKSTGRVKAFKANKCKLPVKIDMADIIGLERYFPDVKPLEDGKAEIYLTSETDVSSATLIEAGVTDPEFTWAQAAIFTRVSGVIPGLLSKEFYKFNQLEALADAKNG